MINGTLKRIITFTIFVILLTLCYILLFNIRHDTLKTVLLPRRNELKTVLPRRDEVKNVLLPRHDKLETVNLLICYNITKNTLQDISEVQPKKDRSIFFHETSCKSYEAGEITISPRQACAVESAARLNPNYEVYLLYTSPGYIVFQEQQNENDRILQALLTYKNINILHLDYDKYTKNTPVELLYQSGKIKRSDYAISHSSDVLRYLTMYKYGGIYLDLDVIVKKSFADLKLNFAGFESPDQPGSSILSFSATGKGHEYAKMCLDDLKQNFNGTDWGYNGPGVIKRLTDKLCETATNKDMLVKNCNNFTIHPIPTFYPVHWQNWQMYFNENYLEKIKELTKDSYIIHIWNNLSVDSKVSVKSKVPYAVFAEEYCPKVYNQCDKFF